MKFNNLNWSSCLIYIAAILCIVFLYLPIIKDATLMVDDWGQLEPFNMRLWEQFSRYFPLWSNRPLAPVVLTLLTRIFELKIHYYFIINLILYSTSILLLSIIIKKRFGILYSVVFYLIALQPIISDTFTFSPINESTPTVSIFLWSIATFIQFEYGINSPKKKLFFILFLVLSLLIYEITLPLFLLNFFISIKNYKKFFNIEIILIIASLMIVIIWQKIIARHIFSDVYSRLNIAPLNEIPFILKKFIYIFIDSASICYNALPRISGSSLLLLPIYFIFLSYIIKKCKLNINSKEYIFKNLILALLLLFSCSSLFILSSSIPTIVGYDNRGLSTTWIVFSFFLVLLIGLFANSFPKIEIFLFTLILFLIGNLFIARSEDFIIASKYRLEIISDLIEKGGTIGLKSGDNWNFIASIDNVSGTLNHTPIFSVAWDLSPAINIYSGIKSHGAVFHEGNTLIKNKNILIDGWFQLPIDGTYLYVFDNNLHAGHLIRMGQDISSKEDLFSKVKEFRK
jgi:hypothetical protein